MIGSLASAAAIVFGAGAIVSRPSLSWTEDRCQLLAALAAGTIGLVSIILLIGLMATGPVKSPKAPQLAYLVAPRSPSELWDGLDLGACVVGKKVPVLVSGGNGSIENPYSVTVLKANDRCTPKSFELRGGALTIEMPEPVSITVHY